MATEDVETDLLKSEEGLEKLVPPQAAPRKYVLLYKYILTFTYWHVAGLYGLYLCFTAAKWQTLVFSCVVYAMAEIGVIGGAHRLWTHRSYKATVPLQILLMLFSSITFQNSVIDWVRNHRMHHRYSDTDADPHNSTRGFFYSHVGWLCVKKHPEVLRRGHTIDMSDIYSNPILTFQKKYAIPVIGALCFGLPTLIPVYFWGETLNNAWHVGILRYALSLNSTFLVNSAAHLYGNKPYDKNISPTQCLIASVMTFGEGFHNYHHVFPWDYRAAELGNYMLNWTTWFIDFMAWIGWAYDLKAVPGEVIARRAKRTGDGSNLWGWGDSNMTLEDKEAAEIRFPEKNKVIDCNHVN